MIHEIQIGPFVFEWDGNFEMYISRGEETLGMVEGVWEEVWEKFILAAGGEVDTELEDALIAFAETIRHGGDYGRLFISQEDKRLVWVGGDADFDEDQGYTSYEAVEQGFQAIVPDWKVEIADEGYPDDETYVEVEFDSKSNDRFLYEQVKASYEALGKEVPASVHKIYGRGL